MFEMNIVSSKVGNARCNTAYATSVHTCVMRYPLQEGKPFSHMCLINLLHGWGITESHLLILMGIHAETYSTLSRLQARISLRSQIFAEADIGQDWVQVPAGSFGIYSDYIGLRFYWESWKSNSLHSYCTLPAGWIEASSMSMSACFSVFTGSHISFSTL